MSQRPNLVFMIKRQGENGKIGPLLDATQLVDNSPLIQVLLDRDYYRGAAEEYEQFMDQHMNPDAVAGDIDGDLDYDQVDKDLAVDIKEQNVSDKAQLEAQNEARTALEQGE